jgi:hypothetical protein
MLCMHRLTLGGIDCIHISAVNNYSLPGLAGSVPQHMPLAEHYVADTPARARLSQPIYELTSTLHLGRYIICGGRRSGIGEADPWAPYLHATRL